MSTPAPPTQDAIRDAWESVAPGYDEFVTPLALDHGAEALRTLDLRPGIRLLDVCAGSGALSIPAARAGGSVTAVDISPVMLDRLRSRAERAGLPGIETTVMDCHALEFPDETFDVVASQNGVTMSANLPAALAEMVRVTKPGGTVLVAAFGALAKAEFLTFFVDAVMVAVPGFAGLPTDPPPPPFQLADRAIFRAALDAAGLTDTSVRTTTWGMPVGSASHLWNDITFSNPIGARLTASLPATQRAEVLRVLDGMLRERSGGLPGATLHTEMNIGTGTV